MNFIYCEKCRVKKNYKKINITTSGKDCNCRLCGSKEQPLYAIGMNYINMIRPKKQAYI